ncbi:Aprataxin and PNK-like factor, partial [Antrostomus carolinensis]
RKNQEADAEEAPTVRPVELSCGPVLIEPACSNSEIQGAAKMRRDDATSRHLVPLSDDNESEQSRSIQRKRVLPSWMLERDLLVQRISEPVMKGVTDVLPFPMQILLIKLGFWWWRVLPSDLKAFNSEECKFSGPSKCNLVPQNTSGFPLESTMGNMEGNDKTGTKNPGSSLEKNDRQLHSKWSKRIGQISSKTNINEETENKEQITGSTSQQAHWGRTSQYLGAQEGILEPDANLDSKTEISDSTRSADTSESSRQIKRKRTPCMYGTGCYRKNPVHFQQFSHPNDDDYHEAEIGTPGSNDNRPECPYGTACYRKNPQHKLEYKHSAPPGKRAVEKDSAKDDEPNEYDLNDSFIDDEEEECDPTDEDSDWEPSSEDKDNEDAETLLKEARRFVKTKK